MRLFLAHGGVASLAKRTAVLEPALLMKLPNGFHVTSDAVGDGIGLTKAEREEERLARGEKRSGHARARGPRRTPALKNPFDEMLRTIGLYDWLAPLCKARGVALWELPCGTKAARVQAVRREAFARLREMSWSYEQIAQLFGYQDHTTIMAALNGNKRGQRAFPKTDRRVGDR